MNDEATDNVPRKLLKAQLRQSVLEYRSHVRYDDLQFTGPGPPFLSPYEALNGLLGLVQQLWPEEAKERLPWLEELVAVAKGKERYTRLRVEAGVQDPNLLYYATRFRLKTETELRKAMDAATHRAEDPPTKKDGAKEKPTTNDWTEVQKPPPSLFPDLTVPPPPESDPTYGWRVFVDVRRIASYADRCPRLGGQIGLKIEATDSAIQRLLKARLHQGALQIRRHWIGPFFPFPDDFSIRCDCLDDMLATATELLNNRPNDLVPWLEELLIEAKRFEREVWRLADASTVRSSLLNATSRHRLKIEAELWKAKNAK